MKLTEELALWRRLFNVCCRLLSTEFSDGSVTKNWFNKGVGRNEMFIRPISLKRKLIIRYLGFITYVAELFIRTHLLCEMGTRRHKAKSILPSTKHGQMRCIWRGGGCALLYRTEETSRLQLNSKFTNQRSLSLSFMVVKLGQSTEDME